MSAAILNRKWITTKEIWSVVHLLVLLSGLTAHMDAFKLLTERMVRLWEKSGRKFLVLYLKEATRMVIAFLNRSLYTRPTDGTEVRADRRGLPLIIPQSLRYYIRQGRDTSNPEALLVTRAVLTCLSVYRVIGVKGVPDFSSITDPFTGISPVFTSGEVNSVARLFPKIRLGGLTWTLSENAGPNGPKATWFSGGDAIALLLNPRMWVR